MGSIMRKWDCPIILLLNYDYCAALILPHTSTPYITFFVYDMGEGGLKSFFSILANGALSELAFFCMLYWNFTLKSLSSHTTMHICMSTT